MVNARFCHLNRIAERRGAIIAFTKSICLWDFDDDFRPLATVEANLPNNRLNEGVVEPDGAFWVGTMQNNIARDGSPMDVTQDTGQLFHCTADGQVTKLSDDKFGITNTLVWTDDGHLITADTLKNEIYSYEWYEATNQLVSRRTILSEFERGLPDGSSADCEGCVWNSRVVGGKCLLRLSPQGKEIQVVDLPCSWPTSCTFGAQNLDTLYITSARFTMSHEHLEQNPHEGGLFAIKPDVKDQPYNRFG